MLQSLAPYLVLGITCATALLVFGVWRRLRGSLRVQMPHAPLVCGRCQRGFPAGAVFCPFDGTRLREAQMGATAGAGGGGRCPRCHRAYESGTRFCPVDAEELLPIAHPGDDGAPPYDTRIIGGDGKICPLCAARYDLDAGFCGRDAHALVTVN